MGKFKSFLIVMIIMFLSSMIFLLVTGVLTYVLKWQADKAMIGIIFSYIFTGFMGGRAKCYFSTNQNMAVKLLEGIVLATLFMLFLMGLSLALLGNDIFISGRVLMIWMLIVGSACLGRIL